MDAQEVIQREMHLSMRYTNVPSHEPVAWIRTSNMASAHLRGAVGLLGGTGYELSSQGLTIAARSAGGVGGKFCSKQVWRIGMHQSS